MNVVEKSSLHDIPKDVCLLLKNDDRLTDAWNNLTPLGRNEWICWIESVKLFDTRQKHIARFVSEIQQGKKRPCCWPGCPHREKNKKYK